MANITNTSYISTEFPWQNPWPYVPLDPKQGVILSLITLPGTFANLMAILLTVKLLRSHAVAPNVFVLGLVLTDRFGIVFCTLPTLPCYLQMNWQGGKNMCDLQGFSFMFAPIPSGLLANIMAADRLLAVMKPFLYRQIITTKKAILIVSLLQRSEYTREI